MCQQMLTYANESGRSLSSGLSGHLHADDPRIVAMGASDPIVSAKGRSVAVGGRPEIPLPPDASSTLFVEGLPANCTRREVSRILSVV